MINGGNTSIYIANPEQYRSVLLVLPLITDTKMGYYIYDYNC